MDESGFNASSGGLAGGSPDPAGAASGPSDADAPDSPALGASDHSGTLESAGPALLDALCQIESQITALRAHSERIERVEADVREHEQDLARREAELSRGQSALAEAIRANEAELSRAGDLESAHAEAMTRIESLEDQIESANRRVAGAAVERDEAIAERDGAIAERDGARAQVAALEADLEDARSRTHSLEAEPAGALVWEPTEAMQRRRARLARMKALLTEQVTRIRQAGEGLRARHEQCERVLARRRELAEAARAIAKAQRRQVRQRAGMKAGVLVLCAVGVLAIVSIMGWLIADQFAPATYVARAVVEADWRTRDLGEDELAEWQRFHESLLGDPRLLTTAAERMERRGITSLGSPGLLKARLGADMSVTSPQPGTLVLDLQGVGAERTRRVLDTFVTAFASTANASRQRRTDGAGTLVTTPAQVAQEPIRDQRLLYAGLFVGGGLGLSVLGGILLWRRLARVKSRFEHETLMAGVMDDGAWADAA